MLEDTEKNMKKFQPIFKYLMQNVNLQIQETNPTPT